MAEPPVFVIEFDEAVGYKGNGWWQCPECDTPLTVGGGDRYREGSAPEAEPMTARCPNCEYQWKEDEE